MRTSIYTSCYFVCLYCFTGEHRIVVSYNCIHKTNVNMYLYNYKHFYILNIYLYHIESICTLILLGQYPELWEAGYVLISLSLAMWLWFWYLPVSPSWITALLWQKGLYNSKKLWSISCRATQDRWVIVKSSDKTWFSSKRTYVRVDP